jgi:hypothetical protein
MPHPLVSSVILMIHTVFILGAGASKHAGAPLMASFLDTARFLYDSGKIHDPDREAFARVFRGMARLQLAHSKASLDLSNVESVFAAFEMARLFGRLDDLPANDVDRLPDDMRRVIVRTLDSTVWLPARIVKGKHGEDDLQIKPQPPYDDLAKLIRILIHRGHAVSIITFNYDTCMDHALAHNEMRVDYGLEPPHPQEQSVPLLKLHGSVNWAQCAKCDAIIPHLVLDRVNDLIRYRLNAGIPTRERLAIDSGAGLRQILHHDEPCRAEPLIVPPTWNKTPHYERIKHVWRRAYDCLRDAQNIFIIGYSWPRSDHFFHHLYALGTASDALLNRFWLIDPDASLEHRYRELLGEQARHRFDRKHDSNTFEESIKHFVKEFEIGNLYDAFNTIGGRRR